MKNKSPQADVPSSVVLPPLLPPSSSAKVGPDSVEVRRGKLKKIFAMMSNVSAGNGKEGGYLGHADDELRCRSASYLSFPNNTKGGGGRILTTTPKGGEGPGNPAAAECGCSPHGIESALHGMNRTLQRLFRDLDHSRDGLLPPNVEALIEERHQKSLENFKWASARGNGAGKDALLAVGNGKDSLEWRLQLQRARTAAADEVYDLEQSVVDYSAEPPMPREGVLSDSPSPEQTLSAEMEAIVEALRKIHESADVITELHNNVSLPWWSSPIRTRDMKIATIRLNYHARWALLWNWRCHNQLLIRATQLNDLAYNSSVKLIKLQENLSTFLKLIEWSKMNTATIAKEVVGLQEQLREANMRRAELQAALVAHSHRLNLLPLATPPQEANASDKNNESEEKEPVNNAPVAELALLLWKYVWPEELQGDVDRVRKWLREVPTVLE